jgi:signal transduction histidine kinase
MKERQDLVRGEISIESRPERGTTIHAHVPLGLDGGSRLTAS